MTMEIPNTTDNKSLDPFVLDVAPIEVLASHTLDVKAMNVSGAALFGTTAAQFHWYGAAVYRKEA